MNIFLIGFMGSGKSTIGMQIAKNNNWPLIDMDSIIEERQKKTISEIFASMGENAFRKMENHLIKELAQSDNQVISCGGGAPCFFDNMDIMNSNGKSVYLKLSPEAILNRLLSFPEEMRLSRPLLANKTTEQLKEYIDATLTKREPFYNTAKIIVLCDGLNVAQTVERVQKSIV
jgi:shikimate kinase